MTDDTPKAINIDAQVALAKSFKVAAQLIADDIVAKHKEHFFIESSHSLIDSYGSQLIREATAKLETMEAERTQLKNSIELVVRPLISQFTDIVMTEHDAGNITKRYNKKIRDELFLVAKFKGLISEEVREYKLGYKPPTFPSI